MISDAMLKKLARPAVGQVKDTATSVARRPSDIPGFADRTPGLGGEMPHEYDPLKAEGELAFMLQTSMTASLRGGLVTSRKIVAGARAGDVDVDSVSTDVIRKLKSQVSLIAMTGYTRAAISIQRLDIGSRMQPGALFSTPVRELLGVQGEGDVPYDGYQPTPGRMVAAVSARETVIVELPDDARVSPVNIETSWGQAPGMAGGQKNYTIGGVAVTVRNELRALFDHGLTSQLYPQIVAAMQRPGKTLATVEIRFESAPMPERIAVRSIQKSTIKSGLTGVAFFARLSTAGEISAGERRTLPASSVRKQ
ncbi:hypothetical protein E2974_16105 [Paracoccus yeei]|uniref:hypothetical protein n=1 Tax=Paracoccus yeei TaxID=147645 RepID=UPI0037D77C7C